jgi:hypothetical protein
MRRVIVPLPATSAVHFYCASCNVLQRLTMPAPAALPLPPPAPPLPPHAPPSA